MHPPVHSQCGALASACLQAVHVPGGVIVLAGVKGDGNGTCPTRLTAWRTHTGGVPQAVRSSPVAIARPHSGTTHWGPTRVCASQHTVHIAWAHTRDHIPASTRGSPQHAHVGGSMVGDLCVWCADHGWRNPGWAGLLTLWRPCRWRGPPPLCLLLVRVLVPPWAPLPCQHGPAEQLKASRT